MSDLMEDLVRKKEDFLTEIKQQVSIYGYGFVPFIGSGISHASGIMVGTALGQYLSYVIWLCVHNYAENCDSHTDSWHLNNRGWPGAPSQADTDRVRRWATEGYCRLLDQHEIHPGMANNFSLSDLYPASHTQFQLPPVLPLAFNPEQFESWRWANPMNKMSVARLKQINKAIRELNIERMAGNTSNAFIPKAGISRSSRHYIVESALRSLYDWRLALNFLARLRHVDGLLMLAHEPDQYVIDSFNIFITRGRKPSLSHQMVSFLVRPLRIRKLLTTNFDTLLEDAFRSLDVALQIFSIEKNSRLPDPNSVSIQKSLIKLHCGLHETRADYSLDESPSDRDKEAFLNYLWPTGADSSPVALPCHLLVLGTSIPDKRNVELIKYVCDRAPEFRLYIIAYSQGTVDAICDAFGAEYKNHLVFTISTSLDLTLYELYQLLTYSLPPSGFKFEFSQYVPPFEEETEFFPTQLTRHYASHPAQNNVQDANIKHYRFRNAEQFRDNLLRLTLKRPEEIIVLDGTCAVTKVGATLFYELKNRKHKNCIWFELEDFSDPVELLSEMFRAISIQLGLYTVENISIDFPCGTATEPALTLPDLIARIRYKLNILIQHYGISPSGWCIFFYGRNVAGSCSGYDEKDSEWAQKEAGNKQQSKESDLKANKFVRLSTIMQLLAEHSFKVIYLPFTEIKRSSYESISLHPAIAKQFNPDQLQSLIEAFNSEQSQDTYFMAALKPSGETDAKSALTSLIFGLDEEVALAQTLDSIWFNFISKCDNEEESARRRRFIYAATLFRQSRHISALFSEAAVSSRHRYKKYIDAVPAGIAGTHSAETRDSNLETIDWIQQLYQSQIRFFNRKPGGLAWMFRDVRLATNTLLESMKNQSAQPNDASQTLQSLRTRLHFWIGEWYLRAFYSSNHVDPLKEAIYHKIMCIRNIKFADLPPPVGEDNNPDRSIQYRKSLLSAALASITKTLMISRESLRFWMSEHRSAAIFYWKPIKRALGFDNFNLSKVATSPEQKAKFTVIIQLMVVPQNEGTELDDDYVTYVFNLVIAIRSECFKLERDILRNANFCETQEDRDNESHEPQTLTLSSSTSHYANVEAGLFFGFRPGKNWDEAFGDKLKTSSPIIDEQFKALRAICDDYRKTDEKEENNNTDLVAEVRHFKHQAAETFLCQPEQLYVFLQLATEYVYRLIRQAKFENRCLCIAKLDYMTKGGKINAKGEFDDNDIRLHQRLVKKYWELVGVFSQMLLELTHHIAPSYLFREHRLKIKLLTFSGMAFGRLQKFNEAHQVLNEGTGIAYNMSVNDSKRELVILRLRRAEVHVLEAKSLGFALYLLTKDMAPPKQDGSEPGKEMPFSLTGPNEKLLQLYRRHLAKLDDAWTVLDEVEVMLSNCMHSAFWCGKLYYLRLMVFSEHFVPHPHQGGMLYYPRACHNQENAGEYLLNTLERGVLSCGSDHYRKLYILNIFAKASKKHKNTITQLGKTSRQQPGEFTRVAVRRILKILTGLGPEQPLPEKLIWSDLLPCKDWKDSDANEDAINNFENFRRRVVENFERVFDLTAR